MTKQEKTKEEMAEVDLTELERKYLLKLINKEELRSRTHMGDYGIKTLAHLYNLQNKLSKKND